MDLNNLTQLAVKAAVLAGNEIMRIYLDPLSDFEIERKSDNSPLTIADKKSNEVIVSFLKNSIYPILSEEDKEIPFSQRKDYKELWIIDPLDGTKEFIKKNGEFTVNIALTIEGVPALGVIYVPAKQILYFANSELGSYKIDLNDFKELKSIIESDDFNIIEYGNLANNSLRLPVNVKKENSTIRIVASRSHNNQETEDYIMSLKNNYDNIDIVSSGSSIKICLVADGSADIYPRFAPTMEWDTAAGHAIALFAGKQIYHIDEKTPISYNKENLLNPYFIVK